MIADLELSADQKRSLEQQLGDLLHKEADHITITGLEVTSITDYHGGDYRVFYVYEHNMKDVSGSAFVKFNLRSNWIEDLKWADQ